MESNDSLIYFIRGDALISIINLLGGKRIYIFTSFKKQYGAKGTFTSELSYSSICLDMFGTLIHGVGFVCDLN